MKFLFGTVAYNLDIQNKALALYEAEVLGAFYTAGVDNYPNPLARRVRKLIGRLSHSLDREISRRRITLIPDDFIHPHWFWEGLRTLSSKLGLSATIQDWFWERSEHSLDRICASAIKKDEFDVFIGAEHGCLATITQAKALHKKTIVCFLSPHHKLREEWVDSEYRLFPQLLTPQDEKLLELGHARDKRRDKEAELADIIVVNSSLTARSLMAAGLSEAKILTIPLGGIPPISEIKLPTTNSKPTIFMYAGPVSVRKGAHYLIEAWRRLDTKTDAELHFYGTFLIPETYLTPSATNIHFHGSVPQSDLFEAYQKSTVLVFPTLLDGFGLVVLEAMAHGLPVITTPNAGAADLIEVGKNGFLVPPKDSEALAKRLAWCLEHPQELLEMRHCALATAQSHTWDRHRQEFREKLEQALGNTFTAVAQ